MAAEIRESRPAESCRPVVLVVEDDLNMRELVVNVLAPLAAEVVAAKGAQDALAVLESAEVAVVLTDLRMPGADGMEVLRFAKRCNGATLVLLITGYATVESAVAALKSGAYDYLRKPFEPAELRCTVERALEHYLLSRDNRRLRAANRNYQEGYGLIGRSPAMEAVRRLIDATAGYDCCVLISGESGSGKELVARQIHVQSARRDNRFIAINCAAIPETIIESELFGYQRGAFTGADRTKAGLFEAAHGGTLFLDEINNAPPALQAKLLRVLQDGSFYRLGETEPRATDARVLAATNRQLPDQIEKGQFREDLYYRLNVIAIQVPALRERRADIPLLANYFITRVTAQLGKKVKGGVTTAALRAFMRYDWPGNVRELENVIKRMIILTETDVIDMDVLPAELSKPAAGHGRALDPVTPQSLEEIEAYFIAKTLRETKGNRGLAAEILGIDKSTLWRKIKRYQLDE